MDPLTAEKLAARRKYRRISRLHKLFRCAEAFAALFLLSWSSARLPAVARLAVHLLRRSASVLLGTRSIFLVGNAIILTLFALSCRHPNPSSADGGDIYEQFLARQSRAAQSIPPPTPPLPPEAAEAPAAVAAEQAPASGEKVRRACRRTRSERMERRLTKPDLRRSVSEVSETSQAESTDDEVEFRRIVDSFIASELKRFHLEESIAGDPYASTIVPYS